MLRVLFRTIPVLLLAAGCNALTGAEDNPTDVYDDDYGSIEETSYSRVYLTSLYLEAMPSVNSSGIAWDSLSNPDLFVIVSDSKGEHTRRSATIQDLEPSTLPVFWEFQPVFEVVDFNRPYKITLFDEDETGVEEIGKTNCFRLDHAYDGKRYLSDFTISTSDGGTRFRLKLVWSK